LAATPSFGDIAGTAVKEAGRIADGLRRAPDLPRLLVETLGSIDERLDGILAMTKETAETTPQQLEAISSLRPELERNRRAAEGLGEPMNAVRESVDPLADQLAQLRESLERLREEMSDIQLLAPVLEELRALRSDMSDIQKLSPVLEEIRGLRGELREVRKVVEPLAPAAQTVGRVADRLPGSGR